MLAITICIYVPLIIIFHTDNVVVGISSGTMSVPDRDQQCYFSSFFAIFQRLHMLNLAVYLKAICPTPPPL